MIARRFFVALALILAVTACGTDTYESVSEAIDRYLEKPVPLTAEDTSRVMSLRETAEQLHRDGKSEESVNALKQAREIIKKARDADLLIKSEG